MLLKDFKVTNWFKQKNAKINNNLYRNL
jgi:hypothetical protein